MKKWVFRLSITINIVFILIYFFNKINSPSYELGRLEKDLDVGVFTADSTIFRIPKGLTVRNVSERGIAVIGQFENERFELVITSDDPTIVCYDLPKDSLQQFGNYYSAEMTQPKKENTNITSEDRIFIKKEIRENYYHKIFIERNHNSEYYKRLLNFDFTEPDQKSYNSHKRYITEDLRISFKNINTTDLAKKWLPVYLYKNDYYLYAPSDWGNTSRMIIDENSLVFWQMDGPLPSPLSKIIKTGHKSFSIEYGGASVNRIVKNKLEVIQINDKTKLSIFKFDKGNGNFIYELYIPVENAMFFDMIVNDSKRKQLEFEFDRIDFEKLY